MQRVDPVDEFLTWAQLHPAVTTDLFTTDDLQAYATLARSLALNGLSHYAECRLAEPRQLDLLVAFNRHRTDLELLLSRLTARCELASQHTRRAWTLAAGFVGRWAKLRQALQEMVSAIWLEFDDVRRKANDQAPSMSACVIPDYGRNFRPSDELDRRRKAQTVTSVYQALTGNAVEDEFVDLLRSCTYALPNGADLIHVSFMSGRDPRSVKIYGVVPRSLLSSYLRTVGWCGSFSALNTAMQRLAIPGLCGDDIYFDLDLSNMHVPSKSTLGIAFSQQQLGPDSRRLTLLQHLADEGQCTSQQAAALGTWATLAPEPCASGRHRRVSRHLDLKTVLGASAELRTKAYLGFRVESNPFVIGH
jgi:hypothetical protein